MSTRKSESARLARTELCPCESGKKYGSCCWNKRFEYHRDKRGEVSKVIPLSDEAVELFENLKEGFREIFGRHPSGKDRLLPDQYFHSLEDMDAAFDKVVESIPSLRPEVIYATRKTDRIVTKDNWKFLTDAEQTEWEEAVDEYFSRIESGEDPHGILPETPYRQKKARSREHIEAQEMLQENLYAAICHTGSFLDHAPRGKYDTSSFFQYYFAARTLDTLRTIYRIFSERYTDDVWTLIRVVYESYLRLSFLRMNEDAWKFFLFISGTQSGTHHYAKRPNGKVDYGHIVDARTKEKVRNFSNRDMAKTISTLDLDIYERLYSFLSAYSHVSLDPNFQYFELNRGFRIHKDDDPDTALEFSHIIVAMWLGELSKVFRMTKKVRRDLIYISKRMSKFGILLIRSREETSLHPLMKMIQDRLDEMAATRMN